MRDYFLYGKGFKWILIAYVAILVPVLYWHYKQGDLIIYLIFLFLCFALGYTVAKNL